MSRCQITDILFKISCSVFCFFVFLNCAHKQTAPRIPSLIDRDSIHHNIDNMSNVYRDYKNAWV